jgi:hypothetical protein
VSVVAIGNGRRVLRSIPCDDSPRDGTDERLREWTGVLALASPVMCASCEQEPATSIHGFGTDRPIPHCRRCSPTPIRSRRLELVPAPRPTGGAA